MMNFYLLHSALLSAASSEATESGLVFQPDNFVASLSLMGRGMLGIFVTIGIIVVATLIINKIKGRKNDD